MALPFATSDQAYEGMMADQLFNVQDHLALIALTIAGALIALVNIFLFRNRKTQIMVNYVLVLIGLALLGLAAMLWFNQAGSWMADAAVRGQIGAALPPLAVLFALLANRFIKKDEKTIRSSYDRLR